MGARPTIFAGDVFSSIRFGNFKVLEYVSNKEVFVQFLKTGYVTKTSVSNIREGLVKDKMMPFVVGEGFCDAPALDTNGEILKEYRVWHSMLTRCYNEKYLNRYPAYRGCEVSDNFKSFKFFKNWFESQEFVEGYVLDKDLLVKGNRVYSENTCCFVPEVVNLLLANNKASRGHLPIGVTKTGENKFRVRLNKGKGLVKHVGYFSTPEEAFFAYKIEKEAYIKEVANNWKDRIDPRVYDALMNYEVEITD